MASLAWPVWVPISWADALAYTQLVAKPVRKASRIEPESDQLVVRQDRNLDSAFGRRRSLLAFDALASYRAVVQLIASNAAARTHSRSAALS